MSADVPVCRPGQLLEAAVARYQEATVSCEVEAHPSTVTFNWQFNNSGDITEIPQNQVAIDRTRSTVTFTLPSNWEHGSLLCWAANKMGWQQEPCIYNIVPTVGRPESPSNCSIANQTADSLLVICDFGHDGGLPQFFTMEVYDVLKQRLVRNMTAETPWFLADKMPPDSELDLVITANNEKGCSRPVVLHAFTLQPAARQSVISLVVVHVTPLVIAAVGTLVAGVCVLVVSIVVVRKRRFTPTLHKHKSTSTNDGLEVSHEWEPDFVPQINADIIDPAEEEFQMNNLRFYFRAEHEDQAGCSLAARQEYAEMLVPPSPQARVTFQCRAATLPRRLVSQPPALARPPASDDIALHLLPSLLYLQPEPTAGPPPE